jgi:hypothetical protein
MECKILTETAGVAPLLTPAFYKCLTFNAFNGYEKWKFITAAMQQEPVQDMPVCCPVL